MSSPLCKLSTQQKRSYHFQLQCDDTVLQKVLQTLVAFGRTCLASKKHGLYNYVVLKDHEGPVRFIVSCNKAGQVVNQITMLTRGIGAVVWDMASIKGKLFTRADQKLLAWGNLDATKEDVAKFVQIENHQELRALMPQAATLINDESWTTCQRCLRSSKVVVAWH